MKQVSKQQPEGSKLLWTFLCDRRETHSDENERASGKSGSRFSWWHCWVA